MSQDLRQQAEDAEASARRLRAREQRRPGGPRPEARKLSRLLVKEAEQNRRLADLKDRIEYLEEVRDVNRRTRPSGNGHRGP